MDKRADSEYHVASFVVNTRHGNESRLTETINSLDGVEVHAHGPGKLVVTAEAEGVRDLANIADSLAALNDVINVAPVYHEYAAAEESAS